MTVESAPRKGGRWLVAVPGLAALIAVTVAGVLTLRWRGGGERESIHVAVALPLSGPQAHYGEEMRNGVTLGVEEANAAVQNIACRPLQLQLVAEDDQADPKTAVIVAQRLVDAGISGMIGHFNSGTSIPAAAVYARAGIPQIAMATARISSGKISLTVR